jgi:hypothetical protein
MTRRGTSNTNARGSVYDRAARRAWLVSTWGDGARVSCYRFAICETWLTVDTVTVDRIVPGRDGGTYRRSNIRPACGPCNSETGGALARHPARRRTPLHRLGLDLPTQPDDLTPSALPAVSCSPTGA